MDWTFRWLTRRPTPRTRRGDRLRLEQLEDRCVPTVTYGGGDVLTHVEAQPVFVGPAWTAGAADTAGQLTGFVSYLVNSPFTRALTHAGYGVGTGTSAPAATDATDPGTTLSDATIQTRLQGMINAGSAAAPTANRLYVLYVQPGTVVTHGGGSSAANSTSLFYGYHAAFMGHTADGQAAPIRYAVIAYPGAPNAILPNTTAFQDLTVVTSHEIAEGITDPNVGYFGLVGWYDYYYVGRHLVTQELADVTEDTRYVLNGYLVQLIAGQDDRPLALTGFDNLTATTVTVSGPATSKVGVPWTATIQVTGSGNLSGIVTLLDGDTVLGYAQVGPDGKGTVTLRTTNAVRGPHPVTAVYDGNATSASSFSAPFVVTFV